MAGYISGLYWLMGGPPIFALLSILADEIDGAVARNRGEETKYGALLDRAVDLTMAGAVAYRIDALWAMPLVTAWQVYNQETDTPVPFGSARSLMMTYALVKGK